MCSIHSFQSFVRLFRLLSRVNDKIWLFFSRILSIFSFFFSLIKMNVITIIPTPVFTYGKGTLTLNVRATVIILCGIIFFGTTKMFPELIRISEKNRWIRYFRLKNWHLFVRFNGILFVNGFFLVRNEATEFRYSTLPGALDTYVLCAIWNNVFFLFDQFL